MLNVSNRMDRLLLSIGASLLTSTAALLLFPGLAMIAIQLLLGLGLIGIVASKTALQYARKRRTLRMHKVKTPRLIDRTDALLLVGVAALYAGASGYLIRHGWPVEALRCCALLLLLTVLVLRPRITGRWRKQADSEASVEGGATSPIPLSSNNVPLERID